MIHKLVEAKEFAKPMWIDEMGNFNVLPTPHAEVTIHDLLHALMWSASHVEFRQVRLPDTGSRSHTTHILWFWNAAYAIMPPQKWRCGKEGEPHIVYELSEARFFRLGCAHAWEKQPVEGMHDNHRICGKCGLDWKYDSSG